MPYWYYEFFYYYSYMIETNPFILGAKYIIVDFLSYYIHSSNQHLSVGGDGVTLELRMVVPHSFYSIQYVHDEYTLSNEHFVIPMAQQQVTDILTRRMAK